MPSSAPCCGKTWWVVRSLRILTTRVRCVNCGDFSTIAVIFKLCPWRAVITQDAVSSSQRQLQRTLAQQLYDSDSGAHRVAKCSTTRPTLTDACESGSGRFSVWQQHPSIFRLDVIRIGTPYVVSSRLKSTLSCTSTRHASEGIAANYNLRPY